MQNDALPAIAGACVRLAGTLPASCSMRGVTDPDPILRLLTPARLQPLPLLALSLLLLSQRAGVCIKITFFYWIQYFNSDAVRLFEWGSAEDGGREVVGVLVWLGYIHIFYFMGV